MGRLFAVKPSEWEVDHAAAIIAGMHYRAEHGALPPTPMWEALERRHDLDPARFDRWHPNIGLLIEAAERREAGLASLVAEPSTPRVASTPEPSSLALGLAAVAGLVAAWAWAGRDMTPSQKAAMDMRIIEAYRDNDPLL